jgi:hypothetical protein
MDPDKKKVIEPVAWRLLCVACKDGFNPEPSLSERVEAAIAVCRLDPKLAPGYHVDYAVHAVGSVIRDYVIRYNKDLDNNKGKGFPWKYDALRMAAALHVLRTNLANVRIDKEVMAYINDLVTKYESVLGIIEGGRQPVSEPDLRSLEALIEKQAAAMAVYASVATSVVKPPPAGGD